MKTGYASIPTLPLTSWVNWTMFLNFFHRASMFSSVKCDEEQLLSGFWKERNERNPKIGPGAERLCSKKFTPSWGLLAPPRLWA